MGQQVQPQISQLEVQFNGPLVKDSQVESLTNLLSLNYNYIDRIVWVKDEKAHYYLSSGNGSQTSDWKKIQPNASINLYDQNSSYQTSEVVILNGNIYLALQPVPQFYSPLQYDSYWSLISGEAYTLRYIFSNIVGSYQFFVPLKEPLFKSFVGDILLDGNDDPIIDVDGKISFENIQEIDCEINRRLDIPDNEGRAYEIVFYEESALSTTTTFSGYIIAK